MTGRQKIERKIAQISAQMAEVAREYRAHATSASFFHMREPAESDRSRRMAEVSRNKVAELQREIDTLKRAWIYANDPEIEV